MKSKFLFLFLGLFLGFCQVPVLKADFLEDPVPTPTVEGTLSRIKNLKQFQSLAHAPGGGTPPAILEIKFLITDPLSPNVQVYFQDSKRYPFHHQLASRIKNRTYPREAFSKLCLGEQREFVCGHLRYLPPAQEGQREFPHQQYLWFLPESDHLTRSMAVTLHQLLRKHLPHEIHQDMIGGRPPRYIWETSWYPQGPYQTQVAASLQPDEASVLYPHQFLPKGEERILNEGFTVGFLKKIGQAGEEDLKGITEKDIVLLDKIPLDLPPVAGIISSVDQSSLSHINLLSKNRGTPNVYIEGIHKKSPYKELIGKIVKFSVRPNGVKMVEGNTADLKNFWGVKLPQQKILLESSLPPPSEKDVINLQTTAIPHAELVKMVGTKAANLRQLLAIKDVPAPPWALALPFSFYQKHLEKSGLLQKITLLMENEEFRTDLIRRKALLEEFRRDFENSSLDPQLLQRLKEVLRAHYPENQPVRFRSSSNAEDLEFFNGAGLYDSKSGYVTPPPTQKNKTLEKAILKVWASLWNYPAFQERELFRIDHLSAKMGLLIHPSYPSEREKINGVVLFEWDYLDQYRFEINVGEGDKSITNPEPGDTRGTLSLQGSLNEENVHIESQEGMASLLSPEEIQNLLTTLKRIYIELAPHYPNPKNEKPIVLDFEFKLLDQNRDLVIKQVRPLHTGGNTPFGLPVNLKSLHPAKISQGRYPYIYLNHCQVDDLFEYVEENYGELVRDPYTGHMTMEFKKEIPGVILAPQRLELWNEVDGVSIYHPFMHHGPYDLSLELTQHPTLKNLYITPHGDVQMNDKDILSMDRTDFCRRDIIFRNYPVLLEKEITSE